MGRQEHVVDRAEMRGEGAHNLVETYLAKIKILVFSTTIAIKSLGFSLSIVLEPCGPDGVKRRRFGLGFIFDYSGR